MQRRFLAWIIVVALAWGGGVAAWAAPSAPMVLAAGDESHVWIIRQTESGSFTVLHRRAHDRPYALRRAVDLGGRLAPGGVAAGGGRLWLVYQKDGAVQSMGVLDMVAAPGVTLFEQPRMARPMPAGVVLRSLAADAGGLWALVSVRDPRTLAELDNPREPAGAVSSPAMPVTVGTSASTALAPAPAPGAESVVTAPVAAPEPDAAAAEPVDRLLHLEHNQWRSVGLPEDWEVAEGARAWLLTPQQHDGQPVLVRVSTPDRVTLYQRSNDKSPWTRRDYPLPLSQDAELTPVAVEGQVVMARLEPDPVKLVLSLSVLRPEAVTALGPLTIPDAPDRRWAVVGAGQLAALIAMAPSGELTWTATDLRGEFVDPPGTLQMQAPNPLELDPRRIVVVAMLAASMLLMLAIWRRDPAFNTLTLPRDLGLADHTRRMAALAIDLLPGVLVASAITGVPLNMMLDHWPGVAATWQTMAPGAVAIAICVCHSAVAEALWGRSLGKALVGLRVVTMTGRPPRPWQAIVRNLLKACDLTVFYILPVLVLVGSFRQRLGDLAARTVVVVPVDPEQDHEDAGDPS